MKTICYKCIDPMDGELSHFVVAEDSEGILQVAPFVTDPGSGTKVFGNWYNTLEGYGYPANLFEDAEVVWEVVE